MHCKSDAPSGPAYGDPSRVRVRIALLVAAVLCFDMSTQANELGGGKGRNLETLVSSINHDTFTDCSDNCPTMKRLSAGKILMGASDAQERAFELLPVERPELGGPREVRIEREFAIGTFDITRREFATFVRESGYRVPSKCFGYSGSLWAPGKSWRYPGFEQTDTDPVVCVSSQDASAYVRWLSRKTGKRYRLPTEAEWEYAARSGSSSSNYWGDQPALACRYANVADKSYFKKMRVTQGHLGFPCNDRYASTSPVGSFEPNGFGLFDMLGNVSQITQDCFVHYFSAASKRDASTGIADCMERPIRGGSYREPPKYDTFWMRTPNTIGVQDNMVGFRVARDLP